MSEATRAQHFFWRAHFAPAFAGACFARSTNSETSHVLHASRCARGAPQNWTRPDAYRFAAPGTPEAKMPGWIDPSATRVRLKEAQEEEARAQAAAEQEALEREIAELRDSHARVRIMLADVKFELALRAPGRKYSPNQPRMPAGNPGGGRWIGAFTVPSQQPTQDAKPPPGGALLAQAGFGTLIAEIPVPGGRRCVYNFGSYSVVVPGAANFRCGARAHWSGVTHGRLLNDN